LALRTIVEDIGADRGILISNAGFQSGAIRAADKANITVTDLDGLEKTAKEDLIYFVLRHLEIKVVELKNAFYDLYTSKQVSPHHWVSTPNPGVDTNAIVHTTANLAVLEFGFDRIRLNKPPYPVKFDNTGQKKSGCKNIRRVCHASIRSYQRRRNDAHVTGYP